MSIIFHIDVNSAYLSWTAIEQLNKGALLDLREIPAIIGGDQEARRGVVLAKSIPAKKYGIRTGEPVANAIRKCPNLQIEPPDHKMYREYSDRLMGFLKEYTPDIEQVSVDECYMDFTGIASRFTSPAEGAMEVKNLVKHRFGFTVNIGISTNKLLAKMASDFVKPDKVHTLYPEQIKEKMWPLPVWELYMAGHSSVETLRKLEIFTIGDLARADPKILELHLKSHGRKLWEYANGIDHSIVTAQEVENKGIGNSVTLPADAVTEEEAGGILLGLAESVGGRLRSARQRAGGLSVEIKYHDFSVFSHQKRLPKPVNNDSVLYRTALELFRELWNGGPIRLLGIRTFNLSKEGDPEQLSMFDIQQQTGRERARDKKHEKLDKALDEIRRKYGDDAVTRGRFLK